MRLRAGAAVAAFGMGNVRCREECQRERDSSPARGTRDPDGRSHARTLAKLSELAQRDPQRFCMVRRCTPLG